MKTVKIVIERSKDHYSAYAENVEGVYGAGDTPEEAKTSALEGIRLFIENNAADQLPKVLQGKYQVVFRFDAESLLNYYDKVFTRSALERMTGINQKLLHHYSKGLKKPRPAQTKKIEKALHNLGRELVAVEL